jgi:hypothetical protein
MPSISVDVYSLLLLAIGADGRWRFGIGDPSAVGWIAVAAYWGTFILACRAWMRSRRATANINPLNARDERIMEALWLSVAVTLLFLGINKQLDLLTALTQALRDAAKAWGWYSVRRPYQIETIAGLCAGGACSIALGAYLTRRVLRRTIVAIVGLNLIVVFVLIRTVSYHYLDILIERRPARLSWILELGSIAMIAWAAYRDARSKRPRE